MHCMRVVPLELLSVRSLLLCRAATSCVRISPVAPLSALCRHRIHPLLQIARLHHHDKLRSAIRGLHCALYSKVVIVLVKNIMSANSEKCRRCNAAASMAAASIAAVRVEWLLHRQHAAAFTCYYVRVYVHETPRRTPLNWPQQSSCRHQQLQPSPPPQNCSPATLK